MGKSPNAFRTISEVADWLDTQAHVLRFWESKFSQVKPVKRAGGRRYYRPADMMLLGGIKKLLHDDGMTIKGAQKLLREKGIKYVSELSQPLDDDDEVVAATTAPEMVEEQPPVEAGTILTFQQPETTAPAPSQTEPDTLDDAVGDLFAVAEATTPSAEDETPEDPLPLDTVAALVSQTVEEAADEAPADLGASPAEEDDLEQQISEVVTTVETETETETETTIPEAAEAQEEIAEDAQKEDAAESESSPEPVEMADVVTGHEPRDSFLPELARTHSISKEHHEAVADLLQRMQDWKQRIAEKETA
ncbi:MerR family transcriptional regulator [Shimia thalassica]|uniref:MerR family transcriptional regulator n=1 Tax=Shimia thalassica TaxID=1715693 RepID=UPI002733ACBF|nr:MerR family transcriptional regulator [Shimia thalassica]MDP2517787.1 MerR family transcriptional regulator [Shimia thalassica]